MKHITVLTSQTAQHILGILEEYLDKRTEEGQLLDVWVNNKEGDDAAAFAAMQRGNMGIIRDTERAIRELRQQTDIIITAAAGVYHE